MEQWISDYNTKCDATLLPYGGGGSGKGVQDFLANQVDFAGSDSALSTEQMAKAKTDAEIAVAKAKAEAELRRARTVSLVPADFLDPDVEPDEFQDAVWMPAADGAVE